VTGFDGQTTTSQASLPSATPWTESEQLAFEKETLGLYWSGHPADRYAADLRDYGARSTAELADELVVSANTIKAQLSGLYHKLNVHSREEALSQAVRLHLL